MLEKIFGAVLLATVSCVFILAVIAQIRVNSGEFYDFAQAFSATTYDAAQLIAPVGKIFQAR